MAQLPQATVTSYQAHLAAFLQNPQAISGGFTYSQGWVEEKQDKPATFNFSNTTTHPLPILDFKPTQGKAISDFLPGSTSFQPSTVVPKMLCNPYSAKAVNKPVQVRVFKTCSKCTTFSLEEFGQTRATHKVKPSSLLSLILMKLC